MFFLRLTAVAGATIAITILGCVWIFGDRSTVARVPDTDLLAHEEDADDQRAAHEVTEKNSKPSIGSLIAQAETEGSAPQVIKTLISALRSQDKKARIFAAWTLGRMGANALTALPELQLACNDSEKRVRDMAERAVDRITKLVQGEAIDEEEAAFWAEKSPNIEPTDGSVGQDSNPDRSHRGKDRNPDLRNVTFVSFEAQPEPAIPAAALQTQEPDAALKAVMLGLKDSDASVRQASIKELGKMGEKAAPAIPALIDLLKDNVADVRATAALALGRMGKISKGATEKLAVLLADTDRDVRCASALALARIGKDASDAVPNLVKMAKSDDKKVQVYACCALAILDEKSEPHVRVLTEALTDAKLDVRGSSAYLLGELGPQYAKSAIPALAKVLKDQDKDVRQAAVRALGEMRSESIIALPALIDALKDADAGVRSAVADTIGDIGPNAKAAVPALVNALKDAQKEVRLSVVEALGEIGPAAAASITDLGRVVAQDEDAEVRRAAILAIGKIQE